MNATRFDDLSRALGRRVSRRRSLGGLVGLAAASAAFAARPHGAAGKFPPCLDLVSCKVYYCVGNDPTIAQCGFRTVGDLPGAPYEQEWSWSDLHCVPIGYTNRQLEARCNDTYPGDFGPHACNGQCAACTLVAAVGCS